MQHAQKLHKRIYDIPKQVRFVIASFTGAGLLFVAVGVPYPFNFLILPLLCAVSYIATWFALLEDIKRHEWIVLFIIPVVWTACWYLSYYMLPSRFVSRLVFTLIHLFIFYIIVGAMNIFNVGVEKNIQLQRAAQAANQFVVVLIFYLVTQLTSTFDLYWIVQGTLIGIFAWLVGIQVFWADAPSETISPETRNLALFQGFVMGHLMILLTFVPFVLETPRPMIITGSFYILNGVLSTYKDDILFRSRVREHLTIFVLLIIATLLTIRW